MLTKMYVKALILKGDAKDRLLETIRRLHKEEGGAAMVEYALLIAGISVGIMATISALFDAISGVFTNASGVINGTP